MTHIHTRQDTHPLNIFYGIRWTEASDNPLSHIYGRKGEKFVLIEPIGQHGTGTYARQPAVAKEVMAVSRLTRD